MTTKLTQTADAANTHDELEDISSLLDNVTTRLESERDAARAEAQAKGDRVVELEAQVEQLEQAQNTATSVAQDTIEELRAQLEEARATIAERDSTIEELKTTNAEQAQTITARDSALVERDQAITAAEQRADNAETKLDQLRTRLKTKLIGGGS